VPHALPAGDPAGDRHGAGRSALLRGADEAHEEGLGMSLEIRRAGFGYPLRQVLSGVDLSVEPGEVVALLGPNGCGKTTLFRTLLGALKLRTGEILLDGAPIRNLGQKERARLL